MLLKTEHRHAEPLAIWNFNFILCFQSSSFLWPNTHRHLSTFLFQKFHCWGIMHWSTHQVRELHVQHGEKQTGKSLR